MNTKIVCVIILVVLGMGEAMAMVRFDPLGRLLGDPDEVFLEMNPDYTSDTVAEIDAYDHLGTTQLMRAVRYGDIEEMRALIEAGADVNVVEAMNHTPLEVAASFGYIEKVKLLLEAGADPKKGAPYYYAKTAEIEALLKEAGTDPEAGNKNTHIILNSEAQMDAVQAVVDEEESSGGLSKSILMTVILGRGCERITELAKSGSDANENNTLLDTPLLQAFQQHSGMDILRCLLEAGADPNLPNKGYSAPLAVAIRAGEDEALLLMDYGAFKDKQPAHLAAAVEADQLAVVSRMLEMGADPNAKADGRPILFSVKNETILDLFLDAGVNVRLKADNGDTILENFSANQDTAPLIIKLIENGADDADRLTQYMFDAIEDNLQALFSAVLKAGAKLSARNNNDLTPLLWAVYSNRPWHVRALLEAGANPNTGSRMTGTPLTFAKELGYDEIVTVLKSVGAK